MFFKVLYTDKVRHIEIAVQKDKLNFNRYSQWKLEMTFSIFSNYELKTTALLSKIQRDCPLFIFYSLQFHS